MLPIIFRSFFGFVGLCTSSLCNGYSLLLSWGWTFGVKIDIDSVSSSVKLPTGIAVKNKISCIKNDPLLH